MIKCILLLTTIVAMSQGQRPPYAGHANRYPVVLPQYNPPLDSNSVEGSTVIGNRIGEASGSTTQHVPYDPYNDPALIERIKTFPKDKQPFWYLNRENIQKHVGVRASTADSPTSTGRAN